MRINRSLLRSLKKRSRRIFPASSGENSPEPSQTEPSQAKRSRRGFLRNLGLSVVALGAAACGGATATPAPTATRQLLRATGTPTPRRFFFPNAPNSQLEAALVEEPTLTPTPPKPTDTPIPPTPTASPTPRSRHSTRFRLGRPAKSASTLNATSISCLTCLPPRQSLRSQPWNWMPVWLNRSREHPRIQS